MAELVPDIDSLKHSRNGMYRIQHHYAVPDGKTKKIHFFYFQDKQKSPPKHPSINESWDKILFCQRSILQSFKQQGTRHQNKKPREVHYPNDPRKLWSPARHFCLKVDCCLVVYNRDNNARIVSFINWKQTIPSSYSPRRQNCNKSHASHFLSTVIQSIHACFCSYLRK
jgi:hypothetical protein